MHSRKDLLNSAKSAVSLVLPAWNECELIQQAIAEADAALRLVADDYEIIVVDDGSTDDTAAIVRLAAAANPSVRLIQHCPNQGYGAALRSGFAAATNELVVFTDADCQFDLTELDRFILLANRYDVVCGYRIDRKDTFLRCTYSRVYNQLVRVLLRTEVRDVDCALKLFHRNVIKNLTISGSGFLVNSEILTQAKRLGYEIVEVGVSHRPRTGGNSTVSIHHIPKVLASLARYWWNEIQFAQPIGRVPIRAKPAITLKDCAADSSSSSLMSWLQVGVLVIAAFFLLTNLGYPLIDRDETRYAEIPREMLATGNWVLPQLNFETYYDKPPLVYWLCAISYQLFGVSETSARLVPAIAALFTIASTMWFGTRIFGKQIGLISGVVLMLSAGFVFTSRYLLLDGVLTLFVTLAMFTAYEAVRASNVKLGWWLLSSVFCALAFLTKGPIAIVLCLPPIVAFTWLSQGGGKPRYGHYGVFLSVVAVSVTPWLIAVSVQDAQFLSEFFYKHNLRRFAGEFHSHPIWYFVPVLLVAGHPWSFLTIPYATFLFSQTEETRTHRPLAIGFLLLWSVWCFVFFSLSRCKLPTYLLPAAPALALMISQYLDQVIRDSKTASQHGFARLWSARSATVATCVAGIAFVFYAVVADLDVSPLIYVWATLWTALLVSSLLMWGDRRQIGFAWASSASAAFLLAAMVMHQMLPAYGREETLFGINSPLSDAIGHTDRAVVTIDHEFSEVPFYLGRSDIPNIDEIEDGRLLDFVATHNRSLLIVKNPVTATQLFRGLPAGAKISRSVARGSAQMIEVEFPGAAIQIARGKKDSISR